MPDIVIVVESTPPKDITVSQSAVPSSEVVRVSVVVNLVVETNGQTLFSLPEIPPSFSATKLFVNGQKQQYAIDYQINGSVLTWLNNDFILETSDKLEFYIN